MLGEEGRDVPEGQGGWRCFSEVFWNGKEDRDVPSEMFWKGKVGGDVSLRCSGRAKKVEVFLRRCSGRNS